MITDNSMRLVFDLEDEDRFVAEAAMRADWLAGRSALWRIQADGAGARLLLHATDANLSIRLVLPLPNGTDGAAAHAERIAKRLREAAVSLVQAPAKAPAIREPPTAPPAPGP